MSVSPINQIQIIQTKSPNRLENINNLIGSTDYEISNLEQQISNHQAGQSIIKDMITNNTDTINITRELINNKERTISAVKGQIDNNNDIITYTKELIGNNNKLIESGDKKIGLLNKMLVNNNDIITYTEELIGNNNKLIESGDKKIGLLEQIIANSNRLIGVHKDQRGLLQESRDLTKESRDLLQGSIDLHKKAAECIEKMLAIMMKNPAKYGGLEKSQVQNLPEVIEVKKNLVENIVDFKSKQQDQLELVNLSNLAKKVVDISFYQLDFNDLPSATRLFESFETNMNMIFSKHFLENISHFHIVPFLNYNKAQNVYFNPYRLDVDSKI